MSGSPQHLRQMPRLLLVRSRPNRLDNAPRDLMHRTYVRIFEFETHRPSMVETQIFKQAFWEILRRGLRGVHPSRGFRSWCSTFRPVVVVENSTRQRDNSLVFGAKEGSDFCTRTNPKNLIRFVDQLFVPHLDPSGLKGILSCWC